MAAPFRPASPRQHPSAGCLCATLKALLLPLVLQVDEELREAAQRETVEEAGVRGELEVRAQGVCSLQLAAHGCSANVPTVRHARLARVERCRSRVQGYKR